MNLRNSIKPARLSKVFRGFARTAFPLLILGMGAPLGAQSFDVELARKSNPIFVGTLLKKEASAISAVQAATNTAIVRVDRVYKRPDSVAIHPEQLVTLELKKPGALRPGQQALFYTQGWILGKGVALKELGHQLDYSGLTPGALEQKVTDAEILSLCGRADVICVGEVINVVRPAQAPARPGIITEHDPNWKEAWVQVVRPMRGVQVNQRLAVRFPDTQDVAFYGVPKFSVGQKGVFILSHDKVSGMARAQIQGAPVETCVVDRGSDFLPLSLAPRVERLLGPEWRR